MTAVLSNSKKYLSDIVYGANDGIITTFAVVAGYAGARMDILPQNGYILVLLFGLANLFSDAVSMGMGSFLSVRARQDLDSSNQSSSIKVAVMHGVVTFCAFIVFGGIPLLPFLLHFPAQITFKTSISFVFLALVSVGYLRGHVTGHRRIIAIVETVLVGTISSSVAYIVGLFFRV